MHFIIYFLLSLSPSLFFSLAPSLVSEFRAEKIEQRSLTLVWREPSYPNSSRTEYEIKYYEKVTPSYLVNSVTNDTWKNSIALRLISSLLFRATTLSRIHRLYSVALPLN